MEFSRTLKTHYKAKSGWLNDPNGLTYFNGQYHLFYQYAPHNEIPFKEPMAWGHCVTKDFLHFEELPVALTATESYEKDGCWSGTAIVKEDTLYLFYASVVTEGKHGNKNFDKQTVSVATSKDGIHFTKYENNPVIRTYPNDGCDEFRDPAIIDNGDTYYLVMATGHEDSNKARLVYYESKDLFHWDYKGIMVEWENSRFCECPSFMKMKDKYLLTTSVCGLDKTHFFSIMVGDFDGKSFQMELSSSLNKGPDQYAGQVFYDTCKDRCILISWITGWHFEHYHPEFSLGCLSTPIELKVTDNKIIGWPVEECQHLLKEDDESIVHTDEGLLVRRKTMPDVYINKKIEDIKVIRDEYVLEIYLNRGEEIYTVVLC